jgi:hypothetical protein
MAGDVGAKKADDGRITIRSGGDPKQPNVLPTGAAAGASLKSRLHEEIVKYLAVSAYLFVCFGVLQWYKAALLQDAGVQYLPLGVAAVKALVIGKFLLIGDAIQARLQGRSSGLLGRIARRVAWLLVILALLTCAEELIVGWFHGQSLAEIQTALRARSLLERVAEVSLMGLIMLPLVATAELNHALGPGVLRSLLLQPKGGGAHGVDTARSRPPGPAP